MQAIPFHILVCPSMVWELLIQRHQCTAFICIGRGFQKQTKATHAKADSVLTPSCSCKITTKLFPIHYKEKNYLVLPF